MPASASSARGGAPAHRARRPAAPIRWDRVWRIAMLAVVLVLLYLYVSAGTSIISTWRSAAAHRGQVAAMERENRLLRAQLANLRLPSTVVEEGRRYGMTRPGEQGFFESGLPGN